MVGVLNISRKKGHEKSSRGLPGSGVMSRSHNRGFSEWPETPRSRWTATSIMRPNDHAQQPGPLWCAVVGENLPASPDQVKDLVRPALPPYQPHPNQASASGRL